MFSVWEEEPEIATRCTAWVFRSSIPIRANIFYFSTDRLRGPPALSVPWVAAFLLWGKAACAVVNHPLQLLPKVRMSQTLCTFISLGAFLTWAGGNFIFFIVGENVEILDLVIIQNVVMWVLVTCVEVEMEIERKRRQRVRGNTDVCLRDLLKLL